MLSSRLAVGRGVGEGKGTGKREKGKRKREMMSQESIWLIQ